MINKSYLKHTQETKKTHRIMFSTKHSNKPKKAMCAYLYWLNENLCLIGDTLKYTCETPNQTDITIMAGSIWKNLSDEDKAPYHTRAEEDKIRYTSEMADYDTHEEYPNAPDGWDGPYHMKYLWKNAKGSDGRPMKFKSFDEAVTAASSTEECCGITKTSTGYSLRIGQDLVNTPDKHRNQGLASWCKLNVHTPYNYDADSLKIQMGLIRKELSHSKSENTALKTTIKEKFEQNVLLTHKIIKLNQIIHSMEQSQSIYDTTLFAQLDAIKQTITNRV